MKNRASLVLMEQLVMVLVFALTASICMQLFVRADRISRRTQQQDRAVVLAQNAAETVKLCGGDLDAAAEILGGRVGEDTLSTLCDGLRLEIALVPSQTPGLGQAQVTVVLAESGEAVFSLTAGWQEVADG